MASLSHENLAKVISVTLDGENDNVESINLFMEYFSEGELENLIISRVKSQQYWTEDQLLCYLNQVVSALAYLENRKIAHRDIKPMNIFVADSGKVLKIGDFGSSKRILDNENNLSIIGTPLYLSPLIREALWKQLDEFEVRHDPYKSDVYSLGLVFL